MIGWFRRGDKNKAQEEAAPPVPRLEVTALARSQLAVVLGRQAEPAALRILVKNPGGAPPQYDMGLEPLAAQRAGDTVLDFDGIRVFIDADSLPAVDGATVDF